MHERKDKWSVGAWMTENPETVAPDLPVKHAFHTMRSRGFRHLLVVEGQQLVGIVTDRDLRRPDISDDPDGWNDYYQLESDFEVGDVMNRRAMTVRPADPLEKAVALFAEHRFGALPVLDKHGAPIGILTTHDAMRALGSALEKVGERLRAE